jgi:hypothetical protein
MVVKDRRGIVRLWVGGLPPPPNITSTEIAGRFTPFGAVLSVSLVEPKGHMPRGGPDTVPAWRGFAYVDLEPLDASSVRKCLSLVRIPACMGL